MAPEPRRTSDYGFLALALAFGLAYFALCVLSFGGTFHNAADEWFMFAVTESLAKWGVTSIDQLWWANGYMGWARSGVDGHLYIPYANFSAGQSLIGLPAYWLGSILPGSGLAQVTLLTNGVVVACTLALLILMLGELGFSRGVALATAALFGLGTMLWPYAKTYFGEPLLGLAFLACFYCALRHKEWLRRQSAGSAVWRGPWVWLTGAALAMALLAKPVGVLLAPFVLIYLLWGSPWERPSRLVAAAVAFGFAPFVVTVGIVASGYARFGPGLGLEHAETFGTPLLTGLWGLLLSPGRSVFVYAPVVALSLPGLVLLYRRERVLTVTVSAFLAASLVFFALL